MSLWVILLLIASLVGSASCEIDYLHNDLRKVCHPIDVPLDVLFILDGSGNAGSETFEFQRQIFRQLVDSIDIGENRTRVAAMQYSSHVFVEFPFNAHTSRESTLAAVEKIEHRSGTARVGRALDKALHFLRCNPNGARYYDDRVRKVVIVLGDGHSYDNPMPAAAKLRDAGIALLALGVGEHVNLAELAEMAGSHEHAFENLTSPSSAEKFFQAFKNLSKSQQCDYSRGPEGLEVSCRDSSMALSVSTEKEFGGIFYIDSHSHERRCTWQANSTSNSTTELTLEVALNSCGMESSFSVNPRGFFFRTRARLQFHPVYSTGKDRVFDVQCFYADGVQPREVIDWQLIREHTQRKERFVQRYNKKSLPCTFKITPRDDEDSLETEGNRPLILSKGQLVDYKWKCSPENYDTYQSILVHSCSVVAGPKPRIDTNESISAPLAEPLIIDSNGCSREHDLIPTPFYPTAMSAISQGVAIGRPDSISIQIRCRVKFCDRLMGECEQLLVRSRE